MKQQQEQEWKRHDFDDSMDYKKVSKTKSSFEFDESYLSWEEQAFGEDAAAGRVWPPRSYSCSFCGRQFPSAQALGGHMNIHRRDRARLNQSPNITNSSSHRPNPKTFSLDWPPRVVSCGRRSDLKAERDEKLGISCPRIFDDGLSLGFGRARPMTGCFDDSRKDSIMRNRVVW